MSWKARNFDKQLSTAQPQELEGSQLSSASAAQQVDNQTYPLSLSKNSNIQSSARMKIRYLYQSLTVNTIMDFIAGLNTMKYKLQAVTCAQARSHTFFPYRMEAYIKCNHQLPFEDSNLVSETDLPQFHEVTSIHLTPQVLKDMLLSILFENNRQCYLHHSEPATFARLSFFMSQELQLKVTSVSQQFLKIKLRQHHKIKLPASVMHLRDNLVNKYQYRLYFPVEPEITLSFSRIQEYCKNNRLSMATMLNRLEHILSKLKVKGKVVIKINSNSRDVFLNPHFSNSKQSQQMMQYLMQEDLLSLLFKPDTDTISYEVSSSRERVNDLVEHLKKKYHKYGFFQEKDSGLGNHQKDSFKQLIEHKQTFHNFLSSQSEWNLYLYRQLSFMNNHWHAFEATRQQKTKRLLRKCEYYDYKTRLELYNERQGEQKAPNKQKVEFISIMEEMHPGIIAITQETLKNFQEKSIDQLFDKYKEKTPANNLNHKQKKTAFLEKFLRENVGQLETILIDQILFFFIKEQRNLHEKKGNIVVTVNSNQSHQDSDDKRVLLSQYMPTVKQFYEATTCWQDLLAVITYDFRVIMPKHEVNFKEEELNEAIDRQMGMTEAIRTPQLTCLGCCPFIIEGQNILDMTNNQTHVRAFPSVQDIKNIEHQLVSWAVGLLNSGGGVFLFDCDYDYLRVLPRGDFITERMKEEYEQRIKAFLDQVEPRKKVSLSVSFVPLVRDSMGSKQPARSTYRGSQALYKQGQQKLEEQVIEGKYVTRVVLKPTAQDGVFYSKVYRGANTEINFSHIDKGHNKNLEARKVSRRIKLSVLKEAGLDEKSRQIFGNYSNAFGHICKESEPGVPIRVLPQNASVRQAPKASEFPEHIYPYATMVMLNPRHHLAMLTALRQQIPGIDCHLMEPFKRYSFKQSKNAALLYHNVRFDDIIRATSLNQRFKYDGRPMVALSISTYLKIVDRRRSLTSEDLKCLCDWLKEEFPDERLKHYVFKQERDPQYFIQTESKASTLYMYYVLNSFGEKSHFKNPYKLDTMSEEERKYKFQLIFTSKPENEIVMSKFQEGRTNNVPNVAQYKLQLGSNSVIGEENSQPMLEQYEEEYRELLEKGSIQRSDSTNITTSVQSEQDENYISDDDS